MVKINRVYTRAGDNGRTVLGDGASRPDLLFVLPRVENDGARADLLWKPGAHAVGSGPDAS